MITTDSTWTILDREAPILALVGATGNVGNHLLPSLIQGLQMGTLSGLKLLTSSPAHPKLHGLSAVGGIDVVQIDYSDPVGLRKSLEGVGILISVMGTSTNERGEAYEDSKHALLEAAASAGVKVYIPSEWGTDHNSDAAKALGFAMFANKQEHHALAESKGLKVISVYNGLLLEMCFSSWLGLDISTPTPSWTIPSPSHPVAFTSFSDLGPSVLSASLQSYHDIGDIPSKLRIYSDSLSIEQAADLWEEKTGGKVQRNVVELEGLQKKWEEIKPTLASGMLGPAIPLLMAQGGFNHEIDGANEKINREIFAFKPRTVADFFDSLPKFEK